jgi:TPR repeat protein
MLGVFYLQGTGVSLDYSEAYFWCKVASTGKVEGVTEENMTTLLSKISDQLSSEAQAKVEQRVRDWFAQHPPTPK